MAKLHIGLSGYDYKEWQGEGLFYEPSVKRANFLSAYASKFNSLEANGTFQRMPGEAMVKKWLDMTGPDFSISPKMVQNVTHFKRLNDEATELAKEFVKVTEPLKQSGKMGPILLQLPPNLRQDLSRLTSFLDAFSTTRWAIEFRNASWNDPETETVLKERNVAWVAAETDDEEAQMRDTADYVFVRLRRLTYTDDQLRQWAERIKAHLANGKDCFVYCRHLDTVAPWEWGYRLRELVG